MDSKKIMIFFGMLVIAVMISMYADLHMWKNYKSDKAKAFQRYVCGLGLGASISPEWGFLSYDMRIDPVDETSIWPVPGGYSYSPDNGFSIADFREIVVN
jgi:hypothetical protein